MKMKMIALAGAAMLAATSVQAAPVVFFGQDFVTTGTQVSSRPNSNAARASFFANLTGVGTETFEGFATNATTPLIVNFGSAGTATLAGTGYINGDNSQVTVGRYAISGTKYFDTDGTFTITFSTPISAFGFYGVDIGDQGSALSLTLVGSNGTSTLPVGNAITGSGRDGAVLYYGFYDTAATYSSISFTGAGGDVFGFDDVSIGTRAQVTPSVPEPASWALMIGGFGMVGGAMRRRAKVSTAVKFA